MLVAALTLAAGTAVTATAAATTTPAPPASHTAGPRDTVAPKLLIDRDFPDPHVSKFGRTYYAYSTESGPTLPVATAPALDGPWTVSDKDGMPNLPAWADKGKTWAPDVSQRADGKYLLYFTAADHASGKQCLGAALADDPAGPFVATDNDKPLVCDADQGGAIDASAFVDADGTHYMLYKNDSNPSAPPSIWLRKMTADGTHTDGDPVELLRNDRDEEAGVIEAPVLVRRDSQYVLFYSQGNFDKDNYATSYATSKTLVPPAGALYEKAYRPLMTTDSLNGAVHGPGGQDVVHDDAGDHMVFHGLLPGGDGARGMYVADLGWANDFPVVRGSRVRYEAEAGALNDCAARDDPDASQGKVVGTIDNDDSWVDVSVFAPSDGAYTVSLGYAAGNGDAQQDVSVNGGAAQPVDEPDHGWESWQQAPVNVTLKAGTNTIRIRHKSAYAELDYVEVA